ncbi:MAG: DNA-processing protein DprA [Gammaproteobacteria bacterium]|nr:DNA-processing protein DprA [Gammaproteobacteria bacterium]MDH5650463.1 DNA-processing protein DprA [Gammaproteobacteria bacterium]
MDDDAASLRWWLALWRAPGIGTITFAQLRQIFQSPRDVFQAAASGSPEIKLSAKTRDWLLHPDWSLVEQDLAWREQQPHRHILCLDDPAYPALLREIIDPPPVLFVEGDPALLQLPQIAVVGSRNAGISGQETAFAFARTLAEQGIVITSGLAMGIDAAGHRGALAGNGATIAVAGTGLDSVYPARHRDLARAIVEQGAVISEFPIGTPPLAANFPRRNRIISGLSLGVLIVEAAIRSGSLITARMALEQGRDVFAIPGSIHNPLAKGCHRLLREGAKLVETAADILEETGFAGAGGHLQMNQNGFAETLSIDPEYGKLLSCIGHEPTAVDVMVARSGLTAEAVCSMLLVLELHGLVETAAGGLYCQTGKRTYDERKHTRRADVSV